MLLHQASCFPHSSLALLLFQLCHAHGVIQSKKKNGLYLHIFDDDDNDKYFIYPEGNSRRQDKIDIRQAGAK